jgi:hypothetical protein
MSPVRPAALIAGAALLVLAPGQAHAQFGGLRRKLEQQVQKTVLGGEAASPAAAAPAFTDRVLQIDDARVGQLLAGLKREAGRAEQEAREQAALRAKEKDYEARNEAHGRCVEPFKNELLKGTGMMMGLALAAKREEQKQGVVGPALRDSIEAVTARMKKTSEAMSAKCGEGPGPSPYDAMAGGEGDDAESLGAKAAGLSPEQYAVLRERVAAFVRSRDGRTGRYAFAAGERAVLERRAGELAPYRALLGG